jgi:ABC-type nickel/cobalt efflux system permease component RcnA
MSSGENQHNSYAEEPPVVYLPPHTAGPGHTENVRSAYLPRRHGLSITSLVLGIVSIVLVFSTTVSFLSGISAVIIGCVAKAKKHSKGMSTAGIIIGSVGAFLAAVTWVLLFFFLHAAYGIFNSLIQP